VFVDSADQNKKVTVFWYTEMDGTGQKDTVDYSDEETAVVLSVNSEDVLLVDMEGEVSSPLIYNGSVMVTAGEEPQYLVVTIMPAIAPFTFVQITDVHIGASLEIEDSNAYLKTTKESLERFTDVINRTNAIKPKFVLITGDLVEWNKPDFFYMFWDVLANLDSSIQFYHIPGNHDRRTRLIGGDDNLKNYHDCISVNGPIDSYLIEPDNYTFEYGGYLFIGLDTGKDFNVFSSKPYDKTPESDGLTSDQLSKLIELPKDIPKIIFMHHPAINSENDSNGGPEEPVSPNGPGGNDGCIANYRDSFVSNYCTNYNVQLVLAGHTHADKFFDADGRAKFKNRPLFMQTRSATKGEYGFRRIKVNASGAFPRPSESPIAFNKCVVWVEGLNNSVLHAYDSEGRHTGVDEKGNIVREIPGAYYIGNYGDTNLEGIIFYNPDEEYKLTVTQNIVPTLTKLQMQSVKNETFNLTIKTETDNICQEVLLSKHIFSSEEITITLGRFNKRTQAKLDRDVPSLPR
jgi:predicted MPP superfamily phosphohydrolase